MHRALVVIGVLTVWASGPAAGDLFPLTEGVEWTYQEIYPTEVDTLATYFDGTAQINGVLTHVQRFIHRPWLDLGVTYWSRDSEGRVYGHGWTDNNTTCTFDPPVLQIDTPLWIGKKWSINTQSSIFGPVSAEFEVTAIGPITVPAGTFICTTIKFTDTTTTGTLEAGRSVLRPPSIAIGSSFTSYAEGFGRIKEEFGVIGRFDELVSFGPRVGVESKTWSSIRQMYR